MTEDLPLCSSEKIIKALGRAGFKPARHPKRSHQAFVKETPTRKYITIVVLTLLSLTSNAQDSSKEKFVRDLVEAAIERTKHEEEYDGSYRILKYPGGDVPDSIGVCTDLIVRAYRAVGIDLQKEVHEDMSQNFSEYPKGWGLTKPDRNIDHRRVLNLKTFFHRKGKDLPVSNNPKDYFPGDLVTWNLPGNLPHIGIVTDRRSEDGKHPLIAHNIGRGPELEDMLFKFTITGHYRYPE